MKIENMTKPATSFPSHDPIYVYELINRYYSYYWLKIICLIDRKREKKSIKCKLKNLNSAYNY